MSQYNDVPSPMPSERSDRSNINTARHGEIELENHPESNQKMNVVNAEHE